MEDIKSKQAFTLLGVKQSYIDSCEILISYLLKYTTADIIFYYGDGVSTLPPSPRFKKINLETLNLEFDISFFPNPLNPFIIKETLKSYDEVVYLDSDIQITPNIKDIFKESFRIDTYPLACRYPWYYTLVNGKPWVGDKVKEFIPYKHQHTPTLGVSCTISNKNCITFLNRWIELFLQIYTPDKAKTFIEEGIHEESIFNALVWQEGGNKFIPTKLAWVPQPEAILEAIDIYNSPEGNPLHPDGTNPSYILTKNTWGGGMSCIPLNKNEFWGLHAFKEINKTKQAYLYIEKYFNKL